MDFFYPQQKEEEKEQVPESLKLIDKSQIDDNSRDARNLVPILPFPLALFLKQRTSPDFQIFKRVRKPFFWNSLQVRAVEDVK